MALNYPVFVSVSRILKLVPASLLLAAPVLAQPDLIPIESFFASSQSIDLSLSPDGEYAAFLSPVSGRWNLFTYDLENRQYTRVSRETGAVSEYSWVGSDYLVYRVTTDNIFGFALSAIRRDGRIHTGRIVNEPAELASPLLDYPKHVLLKTTPVNKALPELHRVNVATRTRRRYFENPGEVDYWLLDREGQVRLVRMYSPEGRDSYRYRESTRKDWEPLELPDKTFPLAFDYDGRLLYVASNRGDGLMGVYRYDLEEKQISGLVHKDPEYDVVPGYDLVTVSGFEGLVFSDQFRTLAGIAYERDGPFVQWLLPFYEDLQLTINDSLPQTQNRIIGRDKSEEVFLIHAYSDRDPGNYYLLDFPSRQMRWLFSRNPSINPEEMATMEPVRFEARDSTPLGGYLTRPVGNDAGPYAMVLLPHAHPFERDRWGFDPQVQFLANRGYAVLQVNYRGSPGFGEEFFLAAYGEIGRKMQTDLEDAVIWAIEEGVADPGRIAIMGEDYAAYAAVAAATTAPGLYRCAVAVDGIYDWVSYLEEYGDETQPSAFGIGAGWLGDLSSRSGDLETISPVRHLERLEASLLVMQGEGARAAQSAQMEQLIEALQAAGKPYQVYRPNEESRNLLEETSALDHYKRIESFLAEHLR